MTVTLACRKTRQKDHQHQEQPLLQGETLFQNTKPNQLNNKVDTSLASEFKRL